MQCRNVIHSIKCNIQLSLLVAGVTAAFLGGCSPVNESHSIEQDGSPALFSRADGSAEFEHHGDLFYNFLTKDEQAAYDAINIAVRALEPMAILPKPMPPETILKLFKLVYTQENDIFWLNNIFMRPSSDTDRVILTYRYDEGKIISMKSDLKIKSGLILGELPPDCTKYEAVLHFHDTIIQNCDFSDTAQHSNSAYGALVAGEAQCEGYAFAMAYLCDMAGIENIVVTGFSAKDESHAWNKIKIDDDWYNLDCTWNDPILNRVDPDFIRYDYFLVPDSDILNVSHFQDEDYFIPPECKADDLIYYKQVGLYFDNANEGFEGLAAFLRRQAISRNTEVAVRFSNKESYDEVRQKLFDENGIDEVIISTNRYSGSKIRSAYKLSNDNLFIIQISLIYD